MSQSQKNTVIIAQHKQDNISIAVEGTTYGKDALEASEANKNINVFEIGITSIPEGVDILSDQNFDDISFCTFDAIFAAYTTASGHNNLPYWEIPSAASGAITSHSLNPYNPDNIYTYGSCDSDVDPAAFYESGHNIHLYNAVTEVGENTNEDLMPYKGLAEARNPLVKDVRSVGLKSPLVLTGWGYNTNGDPVPSGDGGGFHQNAFNDPSLWKSGPVDLRWDNARGVWAGGNTTKIYLVKLTNLYTPPSFSFEVDRSNSRDQYSRSAPQSMRAFDSSEAIYDPEYLAYTANDDNKNYYEQLDYTGLEFPFYEAFIIRETKDSVGQDYYNIWTNDCQDCGHITNSGCGTQHGSDSTGKKVLIENPLRQAFDVGDLAFTVDTGRKKNVNTGSFIGGSGENAAGQIVIDASGSGSFEVTSSGSGYIYGGFALYSGCDICTNINLIFTSSGELASGTLDPNTGLTNYDSTCVVQIYPNNATAETESLPIHWVTQAEFKSQQVVTHVECDNGTLQSCTLKLQTQGYKTCEWCGEDTALINN